LTIGNMEEVPFFLALSVSFSILSQFDLSMAQYLVL
jgi:hypothetical protein